MAELPTALIAGRYRVLDELGRGGMGVVYLVEHVHTGDNLALKLLLGRDGQDPSSLERFKREARASARIKSDNVVKITDADVAPELDGAPFLVMELLNGADLHKELEKRGAFPPAEALEYLTQAARALDKSHAIGIIHRDLKPENLFLHRREDGTTILKILDFGISKSLGDTGNDLAAASVTHTGTVMGTPLYMAPEQARGRISEIGPATDVWAMGLIALQLLTGAIYWRVNSVGELMAHIIAEPLYSPSERWSWLPPAVDAWFARACARDPKARFGSVGEEMEALAVALRQVAPLSATVVEASVTGPASSSAPSAASIPGGRTTTAATAGGEGPVRRPRRAGGVVAGAIVGIVGLGAALFFVRGRGTIAAEVPGQIGTTTASVSSASASPSPAPAPTVEEHGASAPTEPTGCRADADRCVGPISQKCQAGAWVASPVAAGACGAVCTPGTSPPRCKGGSPETCNPSGQWEAGAGCERGSACRDGVCSARAPAQTPAVSAPAQTAPAAAPHHAVAAPAASPTKPDCDPNYFFDAKGEKRFKPECFK